MRLSSLGELPFLERIRGRFKGPKKGRLIVGIGDDAAVIGQTPGKLLAGTDLMAEGVHFDLRLITAYQLGFKLVSVNVSDIYAMGGRPLHLLLALALPPDTDTSFTDGFMDGVADALDLYGASLVGGDLSASPGGMVLTATAMGRAIRPVTRGGARPGDGLYVTGTLGDSACGLGILKKIGRPVELGGHPRRGPLPWKVMEPLIRRHVMPVARKPGSWLRSARAIIDVSDGLALDLWRMCQESGVGAVLDEQALPVSEQAREAADYLGKDPLELALSGGEDYELLFAARGKVRGPVVRIGQVVEGEGIRLSSTVSGGTGGSVGAGGRLIDPSGYSHFERGSR